MNIETIKKNMVLPTREEIGSLILVEISKGKIFEVRDHSIKLRKILQDYFEENKVSLEQRILILDYTYMTYVAGIKTFLEEFNEQASKN
jgi:hypothetical protein